MCLQGATVRFSKCEVRGTGLATSYREISKPTQYSLQSRDLSARIHTVYRCCHPCDSNSRALLDGPLRRVGSPLVSRPLKTTFPRNVDNGTCQEAVLGTPQNSLDKCSGLLSATFNSCSSASPPLAFKWSKTYL